MTTELARPSVFDDVPAYVPKNAALPLIKISKEALMYELPGGGFVKEFKGHVLHMHRANAYWPGAYGEGDSFPTCMSADGNVPELLEGKVDGYEHQCSSCETCPLNQFGPDGEPKQCSNMMWMYILVDGHRVPCKMKVPATSLGRGSKQRPKYVEPWIIQTLNAAKHQALVHTRFTLERGTAGNFQIAIVKPEVVGTAEAEEDVKRLEEVYVNCRRLWTRAAIVENAQTVSGEQASEDLF